MSIGSACTPLSAVWAFASFFNIRGLDMLLRRSAARNWFVYLLLKDYGGDIFIFFLATVAITIYAEAMARARKTPVTGYLLVALLPLVPGGGIYYTMEYCINRGHGQFVRRDCIPSAWPARSPWACCWCPRSCVCGPPSAVR